MRDKPQPPSEAVKPRVDKTPSGKARDDVVPHKGLRTALLAYIFVEVTRIQDMVPPLSALMPGVLTLFMLLVFLARAPYKERFADPIFKPIPWLLLTVALGVVVVVNHYWLLQSFKLLFMCTVAYFVAMPIVVADPTSRRLLLRTFCACAALLAVWTLTHDGRGPGGYLGDENDAAVVLAVGGCTAFFVGLGERGLWKWIGWITLALTATATVGTQSRGGFLALAGTLIAMAYFSGKLFKIGIGLALAAAIGFTAVPASYRKELSTITDSSHGTTSERLYSWGLGWKMFLDYPLIGVGAGNYPWRVAEYEINHPNPTGRPTLAGRVSHSLYFTLIPELGLAGILLFVSLVIRAIQRCRRVIISKDPAHAEWRIWAQVCASGLIGYLVGSAFVSTLFYPTLWFLLGMASALPIVNVPKKATAAERAAAARRARAAPKERSSATATTKRQN